MGFRKLQIYTISFELFLKTHRESLRLPKYEIYELGSKLRLYPDINENFQALYKEYDILGAKINKYIQYVETNWNDPKAKNKDKPITHNPNHYEQ